MNKNDWVHSDSEIDVRWGDLDRREFLKLLGGGILITFSLGENRDLLAQYRQRGYPEDLNAYLRIGEDGRVSCFTGKIEMGQGIHTSLGQMLAEELDVPLESVDMVMGDTALCPYDSGTFGSRSTKYFGPPLRQAAAEARGVLKQLASETLDIPEDRLLTQKGEVFVKDDPQKKISYAQLARGKVIERHLDPKPPIKHHSKHTVSGKPTDRRDALAKVTGEARFTGDIRLPGMLYARILRPPAHGAELIRVDTSQAEKIPGARIINSNGLVAVLHELPDAAQKALDLVKAEFRPAESDLNNSNIFQHLKTSAPEGDVVTEAGNLEEGIKQSFKIFQQTYFNHYVAHAPSEPHTAIAQVEGKKATVWASTQSPFRAQREAAQALGFPNENVRVIAPFVGCGFGGKNQGDQVIEAALLAKASGRPVQVAWSRKEEFFYDTFRPAAQIELRTGLDENHRIVYWDYQNYFAGDRSSQPIYDIPHHRVLSMGGWGGRSGRNPHPFGVGAWRGPGSNTNVFAMESQTDIMAADSGMNPLEFRFHNLKDERMKRVLRAAADLFGHDFLPAPSGKGYGIACTDYLGTYVALMAEVKVDINSGEIRAERLVCAQDTGEVINPEGVRMQIESCLSMGLGYCLREEIRFQGGRILDENFDTYEIPRFSWIPEIETVLVDNPDMPPQGCGEPAVTPVGAVIANAVHDAVGVRLFTLPMTPARVLEALKNRQAD